MNHIYVDSEFAPLRRVVVTQSEFVIPTKQEKFSFLTKEFLENEAPGGLFGDLFPDKQRLWEQERADLVAVLQKYGVEVLRPRKMTDYEKTHDPASGAANFFVRDPFFTVGPYLIEGALRFRHRRDEVFPVRDLLMKEGFDSDAIYVALPKPDTSDGPDSQKGPFLEGGDVLVYGKNIFVGKSGLASDDGGYLWLKHLMEPQGYTVTQVPLLPNVLHLDCAMSLVRDGLMIVAEKALLGGIPAVFADWDKIIVDPEEIQYLTINGLPINERTYLTDYAFKDTIGKELKKRGITVEYVHFDISRSFGGSFRCSTQPLLRE
ncbi:MAG: arginine deiminase family protein [Lachnospiraceae bacterium]|nr:arginine deiminase family protein [Lachnospiraceae bacterium]